MEFTTKIDWKKNNDKSGISWHFKYNNAVIKDPDQISNAFRNSFTNVGPSYATAIPQSKINLHLISRISLNVTQIECSWAKPMQVRSGKW